MCLPFLAMLDLCKGPRKEGEVDRVHREGDGVGF